MGSEQESKERKGEIYFSVCLTEEGLSFELQDGEENQENITEKPSTEKIQHIFNSCVNLQLCERVQFCDDGLIKMKEIYTSAEKNKKQSNNIIAISLANMQKRDVNDSGSGCFDFRFHIN